MSDNNNFKALFIFAIALVCVCSSCIPLVDLVPAKVDPPKKLACPRAFDEFAFGLPNFDHLKEQDPIAIPEPWERVATVPNVKQLSRWDHIEAISYFEEKTQLWVLDTYATFYNNPDFFDSQFVRFYEVETGNWFVVPTAVEGTQYKVSQVLTYKDGVVVGVLTAPNSIERYENPVLARYNVDKQKFELLEETLLPKMQTEPATKLFVLSDQTNGIWIIREKDAMYYFSIEEQKVSEIESIKDLGNIKSIQLTTDNCLYFLTSSLDKNAHGIVIFDIENAKFSFIEVPEKIRSVFDRVYVDSSGIIWVGSLGWLKEDGKWAYFHPAINQFLRSAKKIDYFWSYYHPPLPINETSDGKIWFVMEKLPDPPTLRSGMAWYDSKKNEGCWFTDTGSSILEDKHNRLWILSDGAIYTLELTKLDT